MHLTKTARSRGFHFYCPEEDDTAAPGLMENFAESHGNLSRRNIKLSQF